MIIASPHPSGNTERLGKLILERISDKIKTKIINLYNYTINNCRACKYCTTHDECVINDDFLEVSNLMKEADMLIFGVPSYFGNVPGVLKNLFDRTLLLRKKNYILSNKFFQLVKFDAICLKESNKNETKNIIKNFLIIYYICHYI